MAVTIEEIDARLRDVNARIKKAQKAGKQDLVEALQEQRQSLLDLRDAVVMAANERAASALANAAGRLAEIVVELQSPSLVLRPRGSAGQGGEAVQPVARAQAPQLEDTVLGVARTEPPVAAMDTPEPLPAGGPSAFLHARRAGSQRVLYTDDKGRGFVRVGGTRAWRNNNPGNIRMGSFADSNGAIGDDGAFAIFPDRQTGKAAIEALLRGRSYAPLTLEEGMNRYAPPAENDTNAYLEFVVGQTGIAKSAKLGDLPVGEIRKIVAAISQMEGWVEGQETPTQQASDTGARAGGGGVSAAVGAAQEWMTVARREMADAPHEIAGPAAHPRIQAYHRASSWRDDSDEEDWCAGFVNFCLEEAGFHGTNHPGARSFFWNKGGNYVVLDEPKKGCIGVIRRKPHSNTKFHDEKWEFGAGHVGFVVAHDASTITLLGGNQSNTVCEKTFALDTEHNGKQVRQFVAFLMPAMN